jgi:zinc transport system substrate-binding protein
MKRLIFASILLIAILTGCTSEREQSETERDEKINIYTSIYPLNFIVDEIGGDKVNAINVIPPGTDPHDFEPSLKLVADITEGADLFIYNGAGLEPWAERATENMEGNVIEAADFVELLSIDEEDDHAEEDEDDHGDKDPHIWLSLKNVDMIAKVVEQKLIEIDAVNEVYYSENYEKLSIKLMELDEKYKRELSERKSDTFLVSHSAFKYLAKEYSLNQLSVSGVSPNAEPSPRTLSDLIDISNREQLDYIFFETLASPRSVEMLSKEANLEPLLLHTIEGLTEENIEKDDDYISLMEENLENLKKELLD